LSQITRRRSSTGRERAGNLGFQFCLGARAGLVEIEHRDQFAVTNDRHHQLADRGGIAGDMLLAWLHPTPERVGRFRLFAFRWPPALSVFSSIAVALARCPILLSVHPLSASTGRRRPTRSQNAGVRGARRPGVRPRLRAVCIQDVAAASLRAPPESVSLRPGRMWNPQST